MKKGKLLPNVFISWSGDRSRYIAACLREWLPNVVQSIRPWFSDDDIGRGARWYSEVSKQLEQSNCGILCVTPENQHSPWLLFEAGALAKRLDKAKVCPFLFDLSSTDMTGPLTTFQAAVSNEQETLKLVGTVNASLFADGLPADQLKRSFTKWWPDLQAKLQHVPAVDSIPIQRRSDRDILEEVLSTVRGLANEVPESRKDVLSVWSLHSQPVFGDQQVQAFAGAVLDELTGAPEDANAEEWAPSETFLSDPMEGLWASRWKMDPGDDEWYFGRAAVRCCGPYWVITYYDEFSPYIICARRFGTTLTGRYVNLGHPSDSTPWVGLIVSDKRIDGMWWHGRWDFRR